MRARRLVCEDRRRFLRFHSVRFKYLLFLFVTVFAACGITYLIMFMNLWSKIHTSAQQQLQSGADFIVQVMERSGLSNEEILDMVRPQVRSAELYDAPDRLPVKPEAFRPEDLELNRLRIGFDRNREIYGLIKTRQGYLFFRPQPYDGQMHTIRTLVLETLLLCAGIASVCSVFAIRRAIRPLRQLDAAIQRVAQGDFDARVDYKSRDEMGFVVENFNWMVGELRNIEYLRKDFVSNVSHEFKTPIAAIRGSVKLLTSIPYEHLSEAKFRKYIGLIAEESERVSSLSSNLLRLSRLENQSWTGNSTTFSLDEQIRRAILLMEVQWTAKNIEMDIQLDRVDCTGDEELIQQLWINLISNAVKFTGKDGSICVKLRRVGEDIRVEITDDGIGMSEETCARVFEKFYQGDDSHAREGNGLGLSIVKRIIDLCGGEITYHSRLGEGTTVIVNLPAADDAEEPE